MSIPLQAVKVSEHVFWVGAIDWDVRDFHGVLTDRGTTYNAYLVLGEKIALIDTVKPEFKDELLARISSVIDPARIDYIVSNHAELDHSGCLPEIVEAVKPEKVLSSAAGVKVLSEHFTIPSPVTGVKDGEIVSLGNLSLRFIETRMVHWPESMFSYLSGDDVLFSNDAFGMHLATDERFDDELTGLEFHAAKYYANILLPLTNVVGKAIDKYSALNLGTRIIAPDHGPIWRKDPHQILSLYDRWVNRKPTDRALVVYDTMWYSTSIMAKSIADGVLAGGARAKLMPLKLFHRSDVATELLDAGALVVGSSTLNNNLLPSVADLLTYLKGLKPKGLVGAAFGSYGWSGESVAQVKEYLVSIGVEPVQEDLKFKFVPGESELHLGFMLGSAIAAALRERQ